MKISPYFTGRAERLCWPHQVFRGATVALLLVCVGPGALAAAGVATNTVSASASGLVLRQLQGQVPSAVSRLQPLKTMPGTNRLHLAIGLPLQNQPGLNRLLKELYDPSNPNYHHYLTPEQFTARFGPSQQEYDAVVAFAQANGLKVTRTFSNRMLVDVAGPASAVNNAFHITMQVYQHPTEKRTFYAPNTEPSVPSGLPVLDISGLSDYTLPHPLYRPEPMPSQPSASLPRDGSGPDGTYIGNDFRKAYAPNVSLTGSGQIVGLLQFDGYYSNDIVHYASVAGITPVPPIQNVLLDGYDGVPTGSGGEVEVSLDIEMAISMAPGLKQVNVYEAGPSGQPNDILNEMVMPSQDEGLPQQISSSWAWGGGPSLTTDQIFQQMAAQGQTFFEASGDSDAYLPGQLDDPFSPVTPSDSPYVTVVGGTTLSTAPDGSWQSEVVWNWGTEYGAQYDGSGSSGGISGYYKIPTWQQGVPMTLNQGSTTMRNIPDVALTADNVYVIADDGIPYAEGGTSCAAPLWAAFTALANQQAAIQGKPPVGFLNPTLYLIGKGPDYQKDFHDIDLGNNTWSQSPGQFFAVAGYDLCTGWGTPNGMNTINAILGNYTSGLLQSQVTPPSGSALIAATNQPVFVSVEDAVAITNATVTAAIPGVTNLVFHNDGTAPDAVANDGTYSAELPVPSSDGELTMTVVTTATNEIATTNIVTYTVIQRPANDDFANAIKVPAEGASYLENNRFATLQPGEPPHAGDTNDAASLWWSWTPASNTDVLVDTSGSAIDTVLAVYTGLTVSNLMPVAATTDMSSSQQTYLDLNVTAGQTYRIAVAGSTPNDLGSFRLRIVPGGQLDTTSPYLIVADPLSGQWVSNRYVIVRGTAADPQPDASGVAQVNVAVNGQWQFAAIGTSNWYCPVVLRRGLNNLQATARDAAGNVSVPVNFQLSYMPPATPPNDLFADAAVLPTNKNYGSVSVETTNATKEFGEPDHAGNIGGKSVWWSFEPSQDGVLTLSTTNSTFDTLLAMYTGTNVAHLTAVASDDDAFNGAPGGFSLFSQAVRAGTTYYIAVDGYDGASGKAELTYSFQPATLYSLSVSSGQGGSVLVTTTNDLGGMQVMPGTNGNFAEGTQVKLTGIPDAYYEFSSWNGSYSSSDNPLSFAVTKDLNLTGDFRLAPFTDGFESGGLSHLDWVTAGDASWFVTNSVVAAGKYAARSGVIGNDQTSSLILKTNFTSGVGSFDLKVSSETNFDALGFYVDRLLIGRWSGEVGWINFTFHLKAGPHTLEWRYSKDATLSSGLDAAFIDNVNLPIDSGLGSATAAQLQLVHQTDGSFSIRLAGQTDQRYILQTSTNLINWQDVATNVATDGTIRFSQSGSLSNAARFYRAVVLPAK